MSKSDKLKLLQHCLSATQQSSNLHRNMIEELIFTGILISNCIYNMYAELCNEFLIQNIKVGSAGSWLSFSVCLFSYKWQALT